MLRKNCVLKKTQPRLMRWILVIQKYDFKVKYRCGVEIVVADHLSRLYTNFFTRILEIFMLYKFKKLKENFYHGLHTINSLTTSLIQDA